MEPLAGNMTSEDDLIAVNEMLTSCLNSNPLKRPTMISLLKWIKAQGFTKKSVVEILMKRLHNHAAALEREVELRSVDLMIEMEKVDLLLNEMLPRYELAICHGFAE
jgi:hypothetical protein